MLDHIALGITELTRSRAFHDAALASLGIVATDAGPGFTNWRQNGSDNFSIHGVPGTSSRPLP